MRSLFKSFILVVLLFTATHVNARNDDQDVRAFMSLIYGKDIPNTSQGSFTLGNKHALGLGVRATFPFVPSTYIGLMLDAAYGNIGYSYEGTAGLGIAADIRLIGDIYLSGDYGFGTYSDQFSQSHYGVFWDTGFHWWASSFIDLGLMYRQNDVALLQYPYTKNYNSELRFSFNLRMVKETWMFMDVLLRVFNR